MSEFSKQFWRAAIGVGPGDKFVSFDGKEYFIENMYTNDRGVCIHYRSLNNMEHGDIYDLNYLINWDKTKLFNENGDTLGRCKRSYHDDWPFPFLAYEIIFTPKRHKIKGYIVRRPGTLDKPIKYKPSEFEERFEVVETFKEKLHDA